MINDDYPQFSWLSDPDEDGNETYVSIHPAQRGYWEVTTEGDGVFDTSLDDDAVSAWSTVAYIMCEHGATHDETADMVNAAPENLEWCFDGQVGMYAYDKNEEWDG